MTVWYFQVKRIPWKDFNLKLHKQFISENISVLKPFRRFNEQLLLKKPSCVVEILSTDLSLIKSNLAIQSGRFVLLGLKCFCWRKTVFNSQSANERADISQLTMSTLVQNVQDCICLKQKKSVDSFAGVIWLPWAEDIELRCRNSHATRCLGRNAFFPLMSHSGMSASFRYLFW